MIMMTIMMSIVMMIAAIAMIVGLQRNEFFGGASLLFLTMMRTIFVAAVLLFRFMDSC